MSAMPTFPPEVRSVSQLVSAIGGQDLPILVCNDDDFDDTVVDFSDVETVTLTQTDEHGATHTIVLSAAIVAQMSPYMLLWKSRQTPPIFDPPKAID